MQYARDPKQNSTCGNIVSWHLWLLFRKVLHQEEGPPHSQAKYEQNNYSASQLNPVRQNHALYTAAKIKGGRGRPCTTPPFFTALHSGHLRVPVGMHAMQGQAIPAKS